jgi:S-adenosylmethionine:tRNA ribosyltransferase-isomerase
MPEEVNKLSIETNVDDILRLEDFSYELPPELIAQNPVDQRDQSRLLYYNRSKKNIRHLHFKDIANILQSGDMLVVNNTRVIPARLIGKRASGGTVELLLIKKEAGQAGVWQAMATPIRKLRVGEIISIEGQQNKYGVTVKDIFTADDGQKRLLISLANESGQDLTFAILQDVGNIPLPPYIVRARHSHFDDDGVKGKSYDSAFPKNNDLERYQTVFAREPGAVAAPTAGLHFSPDLLEILKKKGIKTLEITLHVGPGTFKPITTDIEHHFVEAEWYSITQEVCESINLAKEEGRRIIAVGTTTCRALESAFTDGKLLPQEGHTSLFIKPGYQFKLIDGLITNFHLSKSSLLLLVAAFVGKDELMKTYKEAVEERYRFYSYGDSMIII